MMSDAAQAMLNKALPLQKLESDAKKSLDTCRAQATSPDAASDPAGAALTSAADAALVPKAGSDVAECVICWDAAANVVLQPCGHVCACSGCAVVLEDALCPMCRSGVLSNIILQL